MAGNAPLEPIGAQMNVAYAAAMALLDGNALIDHFSADWINSDDVSNLIDRTHTLADRGFAKQGLNVVINDGGAARLRPVVKRPQRLADCRRQSQRSLPRHWLRRAERPYLGGATGHRRGIPWRPERRLGARLSTDTFA